MNKVLQCKNCKNATFAARAPNVGGYYLCGYDKLPRKGNDACDIDKKLTGGNSGRGKAYC